MELSDDLIYQILNYGLPIYNFNYKMIDPFKNFCCFTCNNENSFSQSYKRYQNNQKIDYKIICENENCLPLIMEIYDTRPDRLKYDEICGNKNCHVLLEKIYKEDKHSNLLNWRIIVSNPGCISLLEMAYNDGIELDLYDLCRNPKAGKLIEKLNIQSININSVCRNESCYQIIKQLELEPISEAWDYICCNKSCFQIIYDIYKNNEYDPRLRWKYICFNRSCLPIIDDIYKKDIKDKRLFWDRIIQNKSCINFVFRHYQIHPELLTEKEIEYISYTDLHLKLLLTVDINLIKLSNISENKNYIPLIIKKYQKNPELFVDGVISRMCYNSGIYQQTNDNLKILYIQYQNY